MDAKTDPKPEPTDPGSMNATQLKAYIDKLDKKHRNLMNELRALHRVRVAQEAE